ncbi:MAG: S9 family peptidase [Acidimicrobiales bacterium]
MPEPLSPPVAKRIPVTRERFGDIAADDYAWLRDRDDPDLLPLLEAENAHTEAVLGSQAGLRERIFGEIKQRTQETDLSVPHRKGAWWYYSRTEEGLPYRIHCRRADGDDGPDGDEVVLLDENPLAAGHDYLSVGVAEVSPDGTLLAYSVDHAGDEAHLLHVRDLTSGADRAEAIPGTSYGFAWAADSRTCFYTTLDAAQRPWRVHRHVVGETADGSADVLVRQEDDERFFVSVGASRSGDLVVIELGSKVTSEVWILDAHDPTAAGRVVEPRRQGIEYTVAHRGDELFVLANEAAPNFALWRTPLISPGRDRWAPVVDHRDDTRLEGVEAFASHLVVHARRAGVTGLRIVDPGTGVSKDLDFAEEVHTVGPGINEEYVSSSYRFSYQSLVTPPSVYEEDLGTGQRRVLKQQPVLGDFDPGQYESTRVWASADDGTQVPISVVWKRGVARDGTAPCLLYGYGSYEASMDPWFSIARLSLLDRGMVFAIAHVRGGGELGRGWYEDGKLLAKPNTFSDFVACARHLVDDGWSAPDRLVARGGSAGGLLMGAVANIAPDLFRAIVAEVPFVDALNTILDPTLPLTVVEWEEWGNPIESEAVFRCMRDYTPFENIARRTYPAILATGGLNDPRVGYHEPVKWVQRLRRTVTNGPDRPVLLQMELGAGHGGPSGRYDAWRHEALLLAFILSQVGITE